MKISNIQQLENLLAINGFKVCLKEDNPKEIENLYNGLVQKKTNLNEINYQNNKKDKKIYLVTGYCLYGVLVRQHHIYKFVS